jgi:hypothetical protein
MRILIAAALFVVPGMIDLGVTSWISQFRVDPVVQGDSGMGTYVAAICARNAPASYTPEGRKRLPLLWAVGLLRVVCAAAAVAVLVS